MAQPTARYLACPACSRLSECGSERCIFCWAPLESRLVRWRNVYHASNSVDAWLAKSALELHGVCVRIRDEHASRMMLHGHSRVVVEAAEGDRLLRKRFCEGGRGVRTDTEFLEWQEIKRRPVARAPHGYGGPDRHSCSDRNRGRHVSGGITLLRRGQQAHRSLWQVTSIGWLPLTRFSSTWTAPLPSR